MGYEQLKVKSETKKMVIEDCKKELLLHHPELKNMKISQDKLVYELAKFYLRA